MRLQMHLHLPHPYRWDKKGLEEALKKFAGGQFLMVTAKEDLIYRGEISRCSVPSDRDKRVFISFSWLCELRLVSEEWSKPQPRWFLLKPSLGSSHLDVGFTSYYTQPDEDRLKMWGKSKEICHFFKPGDHTNLVRQGDEFVPYCQLHQLQFWQAIVALLPLKRVLRAAAGYSSQPLTSSAHSR